MNVSNPPPPTQARSVSIYVDRFQPFQSRVGLDTVVRVWFEYDAALVSRLKAILAVYAVGSPHKVVGGWLPKHRSWFVEAHAWEVVKLELLYLGHRIIEGKP
jgi:hypothetical protein